MSIEESQSYTPVVAAPVNFAEVKTNDWLDEESKSENDVRPVRRSRQPSDTEAQEVASAYLGGGIDDHDGLLSSVLVKECVSHFVESTRMAGDGAGEVSAVQEFQSLHPYFGRCEYARAFWFRFTSLEDNDTKDNGYGYRFQVKPMANIRWTKESEVLASPSLEWACWVLELLLNDATELVAHGAVHNRRIYGALVRYLRSPGAPFKGRVVRLLQQLLHHPELFPTDEVPELDALESISRLALTRAEVDRASGK
ncbi:HECT E3 ubiquitin ligase, partial [Phytophthora palmivora]